MDHVTWLDKVLPDRPPVICAFTGWNDGGQAASVAARYLAERWEAEPFAYLDPEEFFDFQVTRPTVRLEDGVSRVIEWPRGEFTAAKVDGRDVVVFASGEPNNRWRTFANTVVEVSRRVRSGLVVTLGAFLTDVPHSREVPVVGSAADEDTALRLGLARSQYEGPTGITGVLHDTALRVGLPSVSLWAAVPHYLPAAPNPKAALALVRRVCALLEFSVDVAPLVQAAAAWEETVAQLLADSEELTDYVQRLESTADESPSQAVTPTPMTEEPIPTGDALAEEFERYLREQGGTNG